MAEGETVDGPAAEPGCELADGADAIGDPPRAEDGHGHAGATRAFSGYGAASTVLVLASVALLGLGLFLWSAYRDDVDKRAYNARVMTAAAEWTRTFISTTASDLDANFRRLREGTAGAFNADFDSELAPYRDVLHKHLHSVGRIEAVALESPQSLSGNDAAAQRSASPVPAPPSQATRTDTVMVIAASVSQGDDPKPQRMSWNLLLDVSNVDGKLLISRMVTVG